MNISIITVVYNSSNVLDDCIKSVLSQDYPEVEYIVIDGGSTDGTLDVIQKYTNDIAYWISEPDRGIYDAMNKGIKVASGDVIGILNSDDFYADKTCLSTVVSYIEKHGVDSCYADLVYVDRENIEKTIRYWQAGNYKKNKFKRGWMPPHPTFFVKRSVYKKYGLFNLKFILAADYEIMLRFLYVNNISTIYIPECLVKMRTGGACSPGLKNFLNNMKENYQAWQVNDVRPNILTFPMKPLSKIFQYINQ